jgi:hypothetical protein
MSYYGKLPYHQRLEYISHQSSYHNLETCGSSFHGLATTLEKYAKSDNLGLGLQQIDKCIEARLTEMNKRSYPDRAHNMAIETLRDLRKKYLYINENHYYYSSSLPSTIIRYNDATSNFVINIAGKIIRGGKNKSRKIKHKSRKTKNKRQIKKTKKRI